MTVTNGFMNIKRGERIASVKSGINMSTEIKITRKRVQSQILVVKYSGKKYF